MSEQDILSLICLPILPTYKNFQSRLLFYEMKAGGEDPQAEFRLLASLSLTVFREQSRCVRKG
jgi:hypothetical protein